MDSGMENGKYKIGYCMGVFSAEHIEMYGWLKKQAKLCDKFILGIPDEWVRARIFGDTRPYNAEKAKISLMNRGWFYDVVILDAEHLSYKKIYEKLQFDVCFYGTEYGLTFEEDKLFLMERGVSFISLMPEKHIKITGGGSLRLPIEDLQKNQKIILFGTGIYFDIYINEYAILGERYLPAYAIDNDSAKWNTEKNGVKIMEPSVLLKEKAEDILVVICSKNYGDMLKQLRGLGKFNYRTLRFANEISLLEEFAITSAEERVYLKKSHDILVTLMDEFDKVCRENHLHYYIICGSLIGVIRHKDLIPWDDDIDLAMPREDFKKLRKIAKKKWSKKNDTFMYLDYDDLGGGAFLDCMPRLFYMKESLPTKCFDKVYGKATADVDNRMFLDIYVMDNAHENERVHMFTINMMKGIYNLCMGHRANINYNEYKAIVPDSTIRLMKAIHTIGKFLPLKFLTFWYDLLAQSANHNKRCRDYIMSSCAIRCIELKYPKEHFGEGLRLPFADIEVMVPSNYDEQLKAMRYNNYMEFPRMSVRKPSHYFNSDIEIW
ncbi:MAG: LicD family protein [Lachnospiraceae bacterium]|nr:LicD family protein [Lachnospiraceae bacterium]